MPPKNRFYAAFYTKADHDRYFQSLLEAWIIKNYDPIRQKAYSQGLDAGTAYGIDMSILALGRMEVAGKDGEPDPEFFTMFMKTIEEASTDYGNLFDIDREENNDDEYWWSTEKLDKEIHSYTGDIYPSYKERYKR